ncbi:hypothetical protein KAX02_03330 [candidate division WOR-3 bacterium]|nr:hypothetical protein [candidate division WOR-3 bacterium]
MRNIEYLILFSVIFIIPKASQAWSEYYPDSAVVIGRSYHGFATGQVGGNRVVVRDSKGCIHVVFHTGIGYNYADSTEIYYVFSSNNGIDWSEPINVSRTDSACSLEPSLAIDSEDCLHCVWKQFVTDTTIPTQGYYDLFYSKYDGIIWSEPVNISNLHSVSNTGDYSSLVIDSNDNLHVVFDVPNAKGDWDIFYTSYNGTTWNEPYNVSDDNYDSAFPCLAIDSGDTLHLVWRKRITNRPIMYSKYNGVLWTLPIVISDNFFGCGACITVDSNNDRHVVFGGDNIYYTKYETGSWSYPINISNSDSGSYRGNISVDTLDKLYIVWEEGANIFRDIYFITFNGSSWSGPMNLTQDTVGSYCPKLGYPVSSDGVDLIWTSGLWSQRPYDIVYMRLNVVQGIEEDRNLESRIENILLFQNKPNPFIQFTDVSFQITTTGMESYPVQLKVYNINGREIKELVDGYKSAGLHSVWWDGKDNRGKNVVNGIYFLRLKVGEFYDVKRMLLIRD